jgi:hypothetical protein
MAEGIWAKVHEDLFDHPKFVGLDNDAIVMWLSALLYCKRAKTDGVVQVAQLRKFSHVKRWKKCYETLVNVGLFDADSDEKNIKIHNFLKWQTSRADIKKAEADRQKDNERKAKWKAAKKAEEQQANGEAKKGDASRAPYREQSQSAETEPQLNTLAQDQKSTSNTPEADSVSERKRNELWDAVVEVCSIDASSIPKSQLSKIGKVVAELRVVKASPEDVHRRANIYKRKFDNAALTPTALLSHWAELTEKSIPVRRPTNAGSQRQAAQAAALRVVMEASA